MVRCSIFYDKNLKEQVFMIRGDERYARSTKTTMTIGTPTLHSANFDLPITVNVFRDVDGASLIVYDNDDPLITIDDWQSTDSGRTIVLNGLGYDADHNIYVRYIGNGKCSPSSSKTELINITNPFVFDATLTLTVPPVSYNRIDNIHIALSNDNDPSFNVGQELQIFYDGTLIDTLTTDNEGVATTSVSAVGSKGLHELKVVFEGSLNLTPVTQTESISVGYKLEIVDPPYLVVHNQNSTFKVSLTDFLNNPIPNTRIDMFSSFDGLDYEFGNALTNNQGIATITGTVDNTKCDGNFSIEQSYADPVLLSNIRVVTVNSLTLTTSSPRLYNGKVTSFSMNIGQNIEGVPVIFYHADRGAAIPETIYTSANGIATKGITGKGGIDQIFRATCGTAEVSEFSMEDYKIYWSKLNESVKQGGLIVNTGNLVELQNTFRLDSASLTRATLSFANMIPFSEGQWGMRIEGISSPSNITITLSEDISIPSRKYSNGSILVLTDVPYEVGKTYVPASVTYSVYDNGSAIVSRTVTSNYGFPIITFSNGGVNSQQISFKKAWYRELWR